MIIIYNISIIIIIYIYNCYIYIHDQLQHGGKEEASRTTEAEREGREGD